MGVSGWFKFSGRSLFSWAFSFQRLTGIILLIYLCMHLTYLTSLLDKTGATYEYLTSITLSKQFLVFDILLVLCGVYHGINGLRVIIHEFGFAYDYRKAVLGIAVALIIIIWLYAAYIMYSLGG